jgi:lactoylglutathione lyase
MRYLHTMVRISDVDASLDFYCNKLGLVEIRRHESEAGRFTLIFLAAPEDKERALADKAPMLELTYNWDPEEYHGGRNFGHLAYVVDDIYAALPIADGQGRDHQPTAARRSTWHL